MDVANIMATVAESGIDETSSNSRLDDFGETLSGLQNPTMV